MVSLLDYLFGPAPVIEPRAAKPSGAPPPTPKDTLRVPLGLPDPTTEVPPGWVERAFSSPAAAAAKSLILGGSRETLPGVPGLPNPAEVLRDTFRLGTVPAVPSMTAPTPAGIPQPDLSVPLEALRAPRESTITLPGPGRPMPSRAAPVVPEVPPAPRVAAPRLPSAPKQEAPNLPDAPQYAVPVPMDTTRVRSLMAAAQPKYTPEEPGEAFFRIMANLGGGADAPGIGSTLLGAASSAGKADTLGRDKERARRLEFDTNTLPAHLRALAGIELGLSRQEQGDRNAVITTGNQNLTRRDEREVEREKLRVGAGNQNRALEFSQGTEQAKLDAAAERDNMLRQDARVVEMLKLSADAKNVEAQQRFQEEVAKWKAELPEAKTTSDGDVVVTTRKPDGGSEIKVIRQGESSKLLKQIKELDKLGVGEESRALMVGRLGGAPMLRKEALRKLVDRGALKEIIGEENFKRLTADARKSFDAATANDPKQQDRVNERLFGLAQSLENGGKLPANWLRRAADLGIPEARILLGK